MLISGVGDGNDVSHEGPQAVEVPDHQQEYQTASELFDLMTRNQSFDTNDEDTLTTQDLVLLYQNIDIGTKLMTSANERKKPNQHVETVVYNEDSDSDSEASLEDISNVFEINQERLNIFANRSLDTILCHKLGGLQIKTSDLTTDYDRQFLFKDPYIKEQLKGLGSLGDLQSVIPTSLLDYICCKRLEDNYNFYMENIIRYVQRTIEQLKRISNGDYLTERAKKKWKEVNGNDNKSNKTKVLSNSISIPLHVECKNKCQAKWDDIIHSEVDVRSLSKILEKKIVVEIPKLICGSYRVFSKRCADNLIISCKRGNDNNKKEKESRVDVVVQLQKSETGQVMSNISSIMILQTSPEVEEMYTPTPPEILPLPFEEQQDTEELDIKASSTNVLENITSMDNVTENYVDFSYDDDSQTPEEVIINEYDTCSCLIQEQVKSEKVSRILSSDECLASRDSSWDPNNRYSSESSIRTDELIEEPSLESKDTPSIFTSPDELRMAMQRLNMQTVLPEESGEELSSNHLGKKKSPTRIRIKSPYENKSFIMEERKRKKLLEIREKRERKKLALGENCKISKSKYIKGNVPQPVSSVTKLSITNKSFYNSIYGHNIKLENKSGKTNNKKINNIKKETPVPLSLDVPVEQIQDEYDAPILSPDLDSKKFINRSYYLDDAETEMMYIQKKRAENKGIKTGSGSTSTVSNDFHSNINLLAELIGPSNTSVAKVLDVTATRETIDEIGKTKIVYNEHTDLKSKKKSIKTPVNSPTEDFENTNGTKSVPLTVECRKSIEKVYDLMKKLSKTNTELKVERKQIIGNDHPDVVGESLSQGSDSGTSLKHQLSSSNPSSFSFDKLALVHQKLKTCNKNPGQSASVVPKVIISSKVEGFRTDTDKIRRDRKKSTSPKGNKSRGDNPLKTITQLLNELEKPKYKPTPDKILKKVDATPNDFRNSNRGTKEVTFRRKSRIDQDVNIINDNARDRNKSPRDKKIRYNPPEIAKVPHQQIPVDDKMIERITKKKLTEIIDEAKEARGEAVRGPPKFSSRLYTLAQPKKCYVQALNEEYQNRCTRNMMMADRLQRLASTSPALVDKRKIDNQSPTFKAKPKRGGAAEGIGNAKLSPTTVQTSDKYPRHQSNGSSPNSRSPTRSPISNRRNGSELPEQRKKIWAVESYVMNHYGNSSRAQLLANDRRVVGHKSRVPLMPKDSDMASVTSYPSTEQANELGNKLHCMIKSLVVSSSPLEAVTESHEMNSECLSVKGSDFNIDVLEDKYIKTAVGTCYDSQAKNTKTTTESWEPKVDSTSFNSKTELEQLENALYSHISGSFQKRLRIKNLTLTPKQSMQKVFLLQSGDAGSLLVKSLTKLNINKCVAETLNDINAMPMPVLSNSHLNWKFMEIPMQIATVGYSFSQLEPTDVDNFHICSSEDKETTSHCNCELNHCKCYKVKVHREPRLEQTNETYVEDIDDVDAVVKATIGTNIAINEERKLNEIATKVTPEHLKKTGQNDTTAIKEEQVVLKTTEVVKIEESKLSKGNQCSVTASVLDQSSNPDHTSSLDMLVGLLNEIKKITGENHVSSSCSDLDTMLCNAVSAENEDKDCELVSVGSLNHLTKLRSNGSIYSLYISNTEGMCGNSYSDEIPSDIKTDIDKPICLDKDVNVNIGKELVTAFTDVPSSFFPVTVNHSTNVTNSLIGVISEPSSQSMFTYSEYHTIYSNKIFDSRSRLKFLGPIPNEDISDASKCTLANENFNRTSRKGQVKDSIKTPIRDICDRKFMKYERPFAEFDPLMKVKRDILVTVYSILVFTVFAALSFPEMLLTDV